MTGSPYGTFSTTPKALSLSKSLYTWSCQCTGTGAGLWTALGEASSLRCISTGGPVIQGSGRCGQVLNVDEANVGSNHSFILSLLAGTHENGKSFGLYGTTVPTGQVQGNSGLDDGSEHPALSDL